MTETPWTEFRAPYRVRFDEAGPDGLLRTSGLLRYAQDVAWLHSVSRGFDRAWYDERGLNWVVRAVDLEVLDRVPLGATLEAMTRVVGQRRVWARRLGEFRIGDGVVARVRTDWLLLDAAGRPTRLPTEFRGAFDELPADDGVGRVELADSPPDAHRRSIRVRPHELDPMVHVNNAVYVDWLEESVTAAAPDAAITRVLPRRLRLEYAGAAEPDAELVAMTWPVDDGWASRLATVSGIELVRSIVGGRDRPQRGASRAAG